MSENINANRLAAYKNHSKNSQEMRLRRHEVTVELRKSKKDDQLLKRRNIADDEDPVSPLQENNGQSNVAINIEEILEGMHSNDPTKQFNATQATRKILSREKNPPIDLIISQGIVPLCVKFLDHFDHPDLQFEATWTLTNLASGTSAQTMTVVDSGAIPKLVALLNSTQMNVADQAIWALGNIAGDGPLTRDMVLEDNVVEYITQVIYKSIPTPFLQNVVWLMSNLCRNKNPPPSFDKIKPMLPILVHYLRHPDMTVVSDICWAFSYISDDDDVHIQAVLDAGALPHLIRLLDIDNPNVITPALRTIGNIVTGNDKQTDSVLSEGGTKYLAKLLQNRKSNIIKEAAWTVSNIAAGNRSQINTLIEDGIFIQIIDVLNTGDFKSQKEAAWAITNTTTGGSAEQMIYLIDNNVMKPYCELLNAKDSRVVKVVLTGLHNMFQMFDQMGNTEQFCVLIEEIGALDKLENLQNHENEEIYKKAYTIVDTYFGGTADESLSPRKANGGTQLEFDKSTKQEFQF